ncbi:MAG TPA: hydrogenase expression/formation C-terminal domain-containing protein [Steroidobacteraceae bacterium]|nr:hydrogenase expression/formation C-terminal domain-containing protein [Steroidobacteraceae bacterium]
MPDSARAGLQAIPVKVETSTGNVLPILHEVRHALAKLVADGTTSMIDLRAIPLAPGEEDRILDTLGRGEVCAEFESMGRSEVRESAYGGCWIVTHFDESGAVQARFVEVTTIPDILKSQSADIVDGLERLAARLSVTPTA